MLCLLGVLLLPLRQSPNLLLTEAEPVALSLSLRFRFRATGRRHVGPHHQPPCSSRRRPDVEVHMHVRRVRVRLASGTQPSTVHHPSSRGSGSAYLASASGCVPGMRMRCVAVVADCGPDAELRWASAVRFPCLCVVRILYLTISILPLPLAELFTVTTKRPTNMCWLVVSLRGRRTGGVAPVLVHAPQHCSWLHGACIDVRCFFK